jgi:D-sedoheptulose 7-phosphate isomerase
VEGVGELRAGDLVRGMAETHSVAVESIIAQSDMLAEAARLVVDSAQSGGKIMTCGNGGSAADAQHLTAELVGRFEGTLMSLPCVTLTTDPSVTTSLANDYGYEHVFAQQVVALGSARDLLIVFSTSGTSANVLNAAREARRRGMDVIAFTGPDAAELRGLGATVVSCAARETPRIQEAHGFAVHALCELVRAMLLT